MTNDEGRSGPARKYDLEERTAAFGEAAIALARRVRGSAVSDPLVSQFVRAATSVGANYCEADDAATRKEFRHRIAICRRESRETKYWLRMLAASEPELRSDARSMWREAKELNLIFSAIYRKAAAEE